MKTRIRETQIYDAEITESIVRKTKKQLRFVLYVFISFLASSILLSIFSTSSGDISLIFISLTISSLFLILILGGIFLISQMSYSLFKAKVLIQNKGISLFFGKDKKPENQKHHKKFASFIENVKRNNM